MYGGEPINLPVSVRRSLSTGREMPKSMTLGPLSVSSTLPGLRSRCTTPARWMSRSASASPAVSRRNSAGAMGPLLFTCSARVGPGMYEVAIQGRSASGSASTTGAVNAPLTRRAAATSWRKRAELRVRRVLLVHHLHGEPQPRSGAGEVHHAHAAGAEAGLKAVTPGVFHV